MFRFRLFESGLEQGKTTLLHLQDFILQSEKAENQTCPLARFNIRLQLGECVLFYLPLLSEYKLQ